MTTRQAIESVIEDLAEDRLREVLDFARFIRLREDDENWGQFGRHQLARAYGDDEPEYRTEDINTEPNS